MRGLFLIANNALEATTTPDLRMTQQTQKLIGLLLLVFLLAWVSYLTFRAYLGPDFLIGFANLFVC